MASILPGSTTPLAKLFPPEMILAPEISTRLTILTSPGSNRTAVPAGMSSRFPYALPRSKES
jgi:hypothetical protein